MTRDTDRRILEAALALLEDGDGAFTYDRLAARAGVSRQTIYSHYPDRASLLIATVDHRRAQLGLDELRSPIFEAPTGRAALAALLDYHVTSTPAIMIPAQVMEAQRAIDQALSDAFERRSSGRRQNVGHVMTRLRAEGDLDERWTVDEATDIVSALTTAAFTADLLRERHWTIRQLRDGLLDIIERALLRPPDQPSDAQPTPRGET